ncbi:MAG TPA: ABC transporter substrate-binding protein, partial [Gemmatimonadaceae bacterium]|nr:ABC transporter substrate-binding protein [Gemmatimonadaceae bacterium]
MREALTPITFSLDFVIGGRHAPWFLALEKGYYREAGLNVTITPGQGSAGVIQRLASGDAQFAFADFAGVLLARSQGTHVRETAVIYAKAPYTIFTLRSSGIDTLKALEGKRLITNAGSATPSIFAVVARLNGIDLSRIEWNNVDPNTKTQLLVNGQADATEYFLMQRPILERAAADRGGINTILLADYGLQLYSNGITTTDDYIARNPDLVRGFVAASLKGFERAFEAPEEAIEAVLKHAP